jgi:hypothetical protein
MEGKQKPLQIKLALATKERKETTKQETNEKHTNEQNKR